ncbi:MAG: NTP transferase domain-containing protein [Chlorobi bacterium]|nr:NTP transferase domain-containing protein [Chlorobiota bacterium]
MSDSTRPVAAVIMAAGKGTRMKNPGLPKVLHPVGGVPMIDHVIACARGFHAERIITILGYQREKILAHFRKDGIDCEHVVQEPQLGTGHAVMQARPLLQDFPCDLVVLSGDVPLLRPATVRAMIAEHRERNAGVTVLTAVMPDPAGYGRVVRNELGHITRIVEHRDASDEERAIKEINTGIYVFRTECLFPALDRLTPDNDQEEYYLTDVFSMFSDDGVRMVPVVADSITEVQGVNTVEQLAQMDRLFREKTGTRV